MWRTQVKLSLQRALEIGGWEDRHELNVAD